MGILSFMQKPPANVKPTKTVAIAPVSTPVVVMGGMVAKTDYAARLEKLVEKANLPGPDYYEFSVALAKKANSMVTEEQKYKDIMDILSSMGVTVDTLLSSGSKYISLLQEDEKSFISSFNQDSLAGVSQKRSRAQALQQEIDSMNTMIKDKQVNIQALLGEATQNEQTLAVEKNAYTSALQNKIGIINTHLTNIKTYLNGKLNN